jgi:hypothetical protein
LEQNPGGDPKNDLVGHPMKNEPVNDYQYINYRYIKQNLYIIFGIVMIIAILCFVNNTIIESHQKQITDLTNKQLQLETQLDNTLIVVYSLLLLFPLCCVIVVTYVYI